MSETEVSVTFNHRDGATEVISGTPGQSVMRTAVNHDVAGVVGECGGEMNCGTCHVWVSEAWQGRVPAASEDELDMLEVVDDLEPSSRLACQIALTPELDGLTVTVVASE